MKKIGHCTVWEALAMLMIAGAVTLLLALVAKADPKPLWTEEPVSYVDTDSRYGDVDIIKGFEFTSMTMPGATISWEDNRLKVTYEEGYTVEESAKEFLDFLMRSFLENTLRSRIEKLEARIRELENQRMTFEKLTLKDLTMHALPPHWAIDWSESIYWIK
jgi:hypothetical protein